MKLLQISLENNNEKSYYDSNSKPQINTLQDLLKHPKRKKNIKEDTTNTNINTQLITPKTNKIIPKSFTTINKSIESELNGKDNNFN